MLLGRVNLFKIIWFKVKSLEVQLLVIKCVKVGGSDLYSVVSIPTKGLSFENKKVYVTLQLSHLSVDSASDGKPSKKTKKKHFYFKYDGFFPHTHPSPCSLLINQFLVIIVDQYFQSIWSLNFASSILPINLNHFVACLK